MDNKKKRQIYLISTIISGVIAVMAFIIWSYRIIMGISFQNKIFTFINLMFFIFGAAIFNLSLNQFKRLNIGIKGERKAKDILDLLPHSYKKFSNVKINYNGQQCEIDFLIISSRGISIVEVKNYRGYLSGEENDSQLVHKKVSAKGNTYETTVRNPIKQVKRQAYILSQLLKDNHIRCWIDSYVFVMGCQCDVNSTKIFTDRRDLLEAIQETGKDYTLSEKDIYTIIQLLKL